MVDPAPDHRQLPSAVVVALQELCELEERYGALVEEQDAEQRKQDGDSGRRAATKQWIQ